MIVRVVDYVANPGGGVRFVLEVLRALREETEATFEIASHGAALDRYRELVPNPWGIALRDLEPANAAHARVLLQGIPGAGPLNALLGTGQFHFDVPVRAFEGADVVWLPWLHRHRVPPGLARRCVASLHDVIALEFRGILSPWQRADERRTVREWLRSDARVVASSNATVARVRALFGAGAERLDVVPLSGKHARPAGAVPARAWPFLDRPYLISPINLTPHKNYEVLLRGLASSAAAHPLVVTGGGTDLWAPGHARAARLRRLATAAGLDRGRTLFTLGYVDDRTYFDLLDRAWALVMPTLAEGGGSFPVWEALLQGIPVVCSDIPVMREMIERVGARVTWFDPKSPEALAARVAELDRDYPRVKAEAVAQVARLHSRDWADVARDYARLMAVPPAAARRPAPG
jgi:glycosyltransferase involved in cell wall biosynthesis